MYNNYLYNSVGFNNLDDKNEIYEKSNIGIDFGNGFKIPNKFVNSCMIEYLEPISKSYDNTVITLEEHRVENIKNESLSIRITGIIRAENRNKLLQNIDYFKKKIRRKKEIIIKDFGVEKVGNIFVESIDFDENHYNMSFMKFELICVSYAYLSYNKTLKNIYSEITENNKKIVFENVGLETDFVGILEVKTADNLNFNISVNGIKLGINGVQSGDLIVIDTKNISVKKNNEEILFDGILEKLKEGENEIVISDNGNVRSYNLSLLYKNTLS